MSYRLLWAFVWLLSLLPLRVLYIFSDLLAGFAHTILRYRRKVVRKNLAESFPEKSEKELRKIERQYYRFLTDYIVETVKLASMSEKQMRRRMQFEGLDAVNEDLRAGRSVVLYLGHYGNWEWVASLPLHLDPSAACGQIYHPLDNKPFDRVMLRIRSRWNALNIKMKDTLLVYRDWQREGQTSIVGFIADQVPNYRSIHLFLPFLNHDTAVFTGAERIARMMHTAVYYCRMTRPHRGEYRLEAIPMSPDASQEVKETLTREYFALLEADIRRRPELWLWSHRRWKRTRARWEAWKAKS